MPTRADLDRAEQAMRALLEEHDLQPPDEVVQRSDDVLFLWHEQKLAVVVEAPDSSDAPPPDVVA
jgi:hypothetical protein